MARAKSVNEVLKMNIPAFDFDAEWYEAFGTPEKKGVWFIWGDSGNGKTSFVMQMCKNLTKFGKVAYDSLEEGACLAMQDSLKRYAMAEVSNRFLLIDNEPISELSERLFKKKSPDFVVIDSFQYTQMTYKQYIAFKEKHRNKLIIFISHATGKQPMGRSAVSVKFDASLKIWVEGYRAFSRGRFIGPKGYYDIWPEMAEEYWGKKELKD